ncbi:MAG: hypothetical protein RL759_156 [Verrucomicrobiota bacterium]|jgi:PST family polysaccharide transporter
MPFARILRSSALIGGAQIIVLAAGFIRTKVIAVTLGAAGVGLIGIFSSFSGNVAAVASWGLGGAAVRLIAASDDSEKAAKMAAVRQVGWALTLIGLAAAGLLFWPVARITFGANQYVAEMAIVALAVPCLVAAAIWTSFLQATGRIKSVAKVQVAGALIGLVVGVPAVYFLGYLGIALSVFFAAAVPALVLWLTAKAECPIAASVRAESADIRQLLRMGGSLMAVGWFSQLSAYAIRAIIVHEHGLVEVGYYQAAFAVAGSLPGFVFAAMGTDFFPRIAAAKDESEAADMAEKQIEAGLLLALPFLVALLTMDRLCIKLLYATSLDGALSLLPWMIWGVFLRLLSWPLGFWMVARGSARTVVFVEFSSNLIATILPLLFLPVFGLKGAAIAYFVSYGIYMVIMMTVTRIRTGRWIRGRTMGYFAAAAAVLLLAQVSVASAAGLYWGLLPTALVSVISVWLFRRAIQQN